MVQYLVGGLAPDSNEPMPPSMQRFLQQTWHKIEQHIPSQGFNHQFWEQCQPRRSTYPACRAVLAAKQIDPALEKTMIAAIQQAYYQRAMNPSDEDTLLKLAEELTLDKKTFHHWLHHPQIEERLQQEIEQCRQLGGNSFPSLVLVAHQKAHPISIDYNDETPMLRAILHLHEAAANA